MALPAEYQFRQHPYPLGRSGVAVSCPVDVTEDTLATITVFGNSMGANGALRIRPYYLMTNNANLKTPRVRFSGASGTQVLPSGGVASVDDLVGDIWIINRNATNSQVMYSFSDYFAGGGITTRVGGRLTLAVDTTADTTIVITGQKATAGDTLTLDSYLVELYYGA